MSSLGLREQMKCDFKMQLGQNSYNSVVVLLLNLVFKGQNIN